MISVALTGEFEVLGVPAPQGSKTRMPNGAMLEGGSATGRRKQKAWRHAVSAVARDLAGERPYDGALQLVVEFRMPMPRSRPAAARRAGTWPHIVKPDIDKLLRSTLDGLTDGGLIADDARVCAVAMTAVEVDGWTGAVVELRRFEQSGVAA